jgi:hypothetical protein
VSTKQNELLKIGIVIQGSALNPILDTLVVGPRRAVAKQSLAIKAQYRWNKRYGPTLPQGSQEQF